MRKEELIEFNHIASAAFAEDKIRQDATGRLDPAAAVEAKIIAKEKCVLCGMQLVKKLFFKMNPRTKTVALAKDGDTIKAGAAVCKIKGRAGNVLSVERTALNFLSFLSGIATRTNAMQKAVKRLWGRSKAPDLLDTRKTVPGWRYLSKYAVRCGGGVNHRMNLAEIPMIKDNHTAAYGLENILRKLDGNKFIAEADGLKEAETILKYRPYVLLCDNFTPSLIDRAAKLRQRLSPHTLIEISGGIDERSIVKYAGLPVERISAGFLTDSAGSVDFSLEAKAAKKL